MPLSPGDKLGPYEILTPIGAGGMGEVYKARDTRLDRIVAIKTSKTEFSERFEREARAVAALNHSNICTLYDVGPNYLVMEYIEGTPLKGPLPIDQALRYAVQICDALDAAHKKGITHRDLKPANILVTKAGIKLLDFGLAKLGIAGIGQAAKSPSEATLTMALTGKNEIVGTLYYMSPEQLQAQANGQEIDGRSDIFSFGLVLYEMLTGKRAFEGSSPASVIAAIMERPAPSVAETAPVALDRVLKRCLEKDPEERWQSARDLKAALGMVTPVSTALDAGRKPGGKLKTWPHLIWPVATAVLAVIAAGLALVHFREKPPVAEPVRFLIQPPDGNTLTAFFAVSPDGRKIAFVTRNQNNRAALWVRPLDSLQARVLANPNEEGVGYPFWSPDSRFVGYYADGKLKKVEASGGPPQTICDPRGIFRGAAWNQDGVIIYAIVSSDQRSGLWRVPDSGGAPVQELSLNVAEDDFSSPSFLPDGKHFLYERTSQTSSAVYVGSLDHTPGNRASGPLVATSSQPEFVPSLDGQAGYVLFLRDSTLFAQPFDVRKLAMAGEAFQVASPVGSNPVGRREGDVGVLGFFSASANGVLMYRSGSSGEPQLTWLDRGGKLLGNVGEPGGYSEIDLSPDGKRVAAVRNGDIWIIELDRNVTTRYTFDGAGNRAPVWSRDGTKIAFESDRDGPGSLYKKSASGASKDELLFKSAEEKTPTSWSLDGQSLVFTSIGKTTADIMLLPLAGDKQPKPLVQTEFQEGQGQVSPDGRWLAYISSEGGRNEVYVRPFPTGDGKWVVSKGTGVEMRWRGDSRELYYRSGQKLLAVAVNPNPTFQPGEPKELFEAPVAGAGGFNRNPAYAVMPDGKKFLAVIERVDNLSNSITAVLNWQAAPKK